MTIIKTVLIIILSAFGILSVFLTLSVIFNLFGVREMEGQYVLPVVYVNLVAGLLYLFAAAIIRQNIKISVVILLLATLILLMGFVFLGVHIYRGGAYEIRTVKAMTIRTGFTGAVWATLWFVSKMEDLRK